MSMNLFILPFNMLKLKTKQSKRRLFFKVVFSLFYLVIGAEIFLRIFAPVPMLPRYVCTGSYGIRNNEADKSYWHTTPEYRIHIRTNSKGIRSDEEIPYEKPTNVKRIVVLGDSFGMGYGVDLKDTFTAQMEKQLTEYGVNTQVINLSVSGFGNAEQLIALRKEGMKYSPDMVLLVWNGSDPGDNFRSNLFGLEGGRLIKKNETFLPGVEIREFLFQFVAYRWIAGNSQLYNFARTGAAYLVKYKILPMLRKMSFKDDKAAKPKETVVSVSDYPKELTIELVKEINRECISNESQFMVIDIPSWRSRTEFKSKFPIDSDLISDVSLYSPIGDFSKYMGKKLYWEKSHGHFTPLGCQIVGRGLADFILSNKLIALDDNTINREGQSTATRE